MMKGDTMFNLDVYYDCEQVHHEEFETEEDAYARKSDIKVTLSVPADEGYYSAQIDVIVDCESVFCAFPMEDASFETRAKFTPEQIAFKWMEMFIVTVGSDEE